MRRWWRREWLSWAILVGMFVASALCWSRVPTRMAVHWGLDGTPDRYGGRVEGLLGLPIVALGLYALLRLLPLIDPRRANYAQFAGPYALIRLATLAVLAAIHGAIIATALGYPLDMMRAIPLAIGGLFLVLGSLMGKLRQSWFVGIRTPWTLSSARSWGKTHRLGGWVFIGAGLVFAVAGLLGSSAMLLIGFGGFFIALIGLVAYSYVVWRDDGAPSPPTDLRPADPKVL